MQTSLGHAAPIIALMLLALKGAEFGLRPHQQRRVQEVAEDWALRLSHVRPLDALKPVMSRHGQALALATAGCLFLLMLIYCFPYRDSGSRADGLFASVFGVALLFVPTLIVIARVGPRVAGWVCGDGRFLPFVLRSLGYFFGCWAVIAALSPLFASRGAPSFVRSDNGPEFIAAEVKAWLEGQGGCALLHRP